MRETKISCPGECERISFTWPEYKHPDGARGGRESFCRIKHKSVGLLSSAITFVCQDVLLYHQVIGWRSQATPRVSCVLARSNKPLQKINVQRQSIAKKA